MIDIQIASEDELYDKFDRNRNTLNPGFISFVSGKLSEGRDEEGITIHSETALDEEHVHQVLQHYMDTELKKNKQQQRQNTMSEIYLFAIGIVCIVVGILLKDISTIYLQILSLTAGFAIKEAATIFFIKKPMNRLNRARIMLFSRSNLVLDHPGK